MTNLIIYHEPGRSEISRVILTLAKLGRVSKNLNTGDRRLSSVPQAQRIRRVAVVVTAVAVVVAVVVAAVAAAVVLSPTKEVTREFIGMLV
jgi:hypothetical protein